MIQGPAGERSAFRQARGNLWGAKKAMRQNAKVLLVTLKAAPGFNIAPSIGIHQLQHFLEQRGIACDVLDREFEDEEPYVEKARAGAYDVIGMSVSHLHMQVDLTLLWRFRMAAREGGKNTLLVAGGQEATINWKQWLELAVDVICLGFGEYALHRFCMRVVANPPMLGEPADLDALAGGIAGTAYRNGAGDFIHQPTPKLTREAFSELCYDQVLTNTVPYHAYWDKVRAASADTTLGAADFFAENVRVYTTSHCPRRCGFCATQVYLSEAQQEKMFILMLSAEEVADLVHMYVNRYGARSILFSDDDFPVGNKAGLERLDRLCDILIHFKDTGEIPREVRFSCQARVADFLVKDEAGRRVPNRPLLAKLARAGFMSFGIGVETFSDRILHVPSINKIGITVADCRTVIEAMLEAGLVPQINLILGIPEYTVDELADTMETAVHYFRSHCDIAMTKLMWAWPGAPLYEAHTYPMVSQTWKNPWNGQEAELSDFFIPHDPAIARVIDRFDQVAAEELRGTVGRMGWEGKIVHKRVVNLTGFIGIARLLDRPDLAATYTRLLEDVICRELN